MIFGEQPEQPEALSLAILFERFHCLYRPGEYVNQPCILMVEIAEAANCQVKHDQQTRENLRRRAEYEAQKKRGAV